MRKILQYLRYFIQSLYNRGVAFTFRLLWEEWKGERELGIETLQIENLQGMNIAAGSLEETHHYQGASYYILNELFRQLPSEMLNREFVDLGCGKGRAMVLAAKFGFTKIRGVEIAEELCRVAELNWNKIKNRFPGVELKVLHLNASQFIPNPETGVIYLFNPFPEKVMQNVVKNIQMHCRQNPHTRIVYINPLFLSSWTNAGFLVEYELRSKRYCEGVILKIS